MIFRRRDMLLGGAALALAGRLPAAEPAPRSIRVASNQGVENATLQRLMADRGFARRLSLDIVEVDSTDIAGPIAALENGTADVCMISAYAGVLPAIEAGQPIRVIGTAMHVPAIAVCSADPTLSDVAQLKGRSVGIGERQGLLHLLMLALLRQRGMAAKDVRFVSIGSNAQVFRAVLHREVDAGPVGVANLGNPNAHTLAGGELWRALPDFPYQLGYASLDALRGRADAVARCLAVYAALFRYVSQVEVEAPYLAARAAVGGDRQEAEQVLKFIREVQPYSRDPGVAPSQIAYLQQVNVAAGLQRRILPTSAIVDPAPAVVARRLLAREESVSRW